MRLNVAPPHLDDDNCGSAHFSDASSLRYPVTSKSRIVGAGGREEGRESGVRT